jgi:crotonobetainyl-CoA:carnitine CoA-transferase CaiB-like acyl-CoA transferase
MTEDRVTETRPGPLSGIRIVDLSIALTGPYACALLADQGAEVIKVERPGIGDIARWIGASVNGMSALYATCNRGKRGIAVDVHTEAGRDIVRELVARADVFVQNFRPGVMERLGLGYDDLAAGRDDLVYVSLSAFGSEGPYGRRGAYDTVIQAYGGLAASQADPADGKPVFMRQTAADKITAMYAVQAITSGLLARERGFGGQHVEVSMLDAVVSFLWADAAGNEVLLDSDGSYPSSFVQAVQPFEFLDGWGVATPTSDADFAGTCRAFGVDGYDDPRVATIGERNKHRDLAKVLSSRWHEVARTLTVAEGMARMEAENVPCGVVYTAAELADDPHVQAVGMLETQNHPIVGRIRQPRHPARFQGTPAHLAGGAPGLGEHTDEILAELGLTDRVDELRADKVVA